VKFGLSLGDFFLSSFLAAALLHLSEDDGTSITDFAFPVINILPGLMTSRQKAPPESNSISQLSNPEYTYDM
jgi:hypothetical protein